MRRALPSHPHVDHLKKQAKELLAAHKRGDAQAIQRLHEALPSFAVPRRDPASAARASRRAVRNRTRIRVVEEGYSVFGASNGKEALRLFRDEKLRPDVILLDIMMPEMDGRAFRREQQRDVEFAPIPIVVFTAHGRARETAEQLGTVYFLRKPLGIDELLRVVRAAGS